MIWHKLIQAAVLALLSVAVTLGLLACNRSRGQAQAPANTAAPAVIQVSTAAAIQRQLPRFFEATGSLAADVQTDIQPQTAGKIVAVGVDLGSHVRKGQLLVRLDDMDYKLHLDQAVAQLENARAAVKQAEEKIGLKAGQSFDPEKVAEVAAARANYDLAEKNLQRAAKLIESGDVSRSFYDQQKAQRDSLREVYQSAIAQARQNYAGVLVARTNVTNAQSQLDLARRTLSYTVVVSPIDGYVAERPVDVGTYVSTTSKIATIVRTNPLRMRMDIPEQAIPSIRQGESVSLTTSAWPDRSFNGRIVRISPNLAANSRTLTVEAEVENAKGELKPGQFATARILLPQSAPAVLVPQRALRPISGATYVFVIRNGHAEQRLVQPGQSEGDLVEIKTGVAEGEAVATSNVDQLSDGIAVRQ